MSRAFYTTRTLCAVMLLTAATCAGSAAPALDDAAYLSPQLIDMTGLLAPPRDDADALQHDLEAVRSAQSERMPEELERAAADGAVSVFLFADVLGENFASERLPLTTAFFDKVNREFLAFLRLTKDCWRRPRPFEIDGSIVPLESFRQSASARPGSSLPPAPVEAGSPCLAVSRDSMYSYAYPSGHAAFGAMTAILLAELIPERRAQLFERGWEYGDARMIAGIHFPSDLEAGRILATVLVALMMQNERCRADLALVRAELRAQLGFEP